MRIYFLREFSVCCHPKILLPWRRDVTTSPLYCFSSASLILGPQMVHIDPRKYTQSYPHRGTSWRGGGGEWWNPLEFLIRFSFSKRSCLQWKAFYLLYKLRYFFMAGGATGGLWHHQTWSPSWIVSRIKNKVKTVRIDIFLRSACKITQITLHHHHHYSSIFFLPSSPSLPSLPPPSTSFCCFVPPSPPPPPPPTPHFSIGNLSLWKEPNFLTRLPSKARLTHPGAQLRHYFHFLR